MSDRKVLISIRPQFCERILNGEKIIEFRKNAPKLNPPFTCIIYCSKGSGKDTYNVTHGKVVGEFTCDKIESFEVAGSGKIPDWENLNLCRGTLSPEAISEYVGNGKTGYAWNIKDLKIYGEPKELSSLGLSRPPQSWCYY